MRIGFRILHTNETECSVTHAVKPSLWKCSTIFSCLQSRISTSIKESCQENLWLMFFCGTLLSDLCFLHFYYDLDLFECSKGC